MEKNYSTYEDCLTDVRRHDEGILHEGNIFCFDLIMNSSSNFTVTGPSDTAVTVGATVMALVLAIGILGNILVVFVVIRKRENLSIINIFIVSQCTNDLLNVGINNGLVLISYCMGTWTMGLGVCEMLMHFTVLLMGSSLWHTALIAIHRLIVVVFNQCYKTISKKAYTLFVLLFARIVPILFLVQPSLGNMVNYEPKLLRCVIKKDFGPYTLLVSIFLMMLPSLILIICYIAIFAKVRQSAGTFRAHRRREWLRREMMITKMFGLVFLLIILGYLPYGIVRFIDKKFLWHPDFYVVITVLYAAANSVNPIIYGCMDCNIRQGCLSTLQQCFRCGRTSDKTPSPVNGTIMDAVTTNPTIANL